MQEEVIQFIKKDKELQKHIWNKFIQYCLISSKGGKK